MEKLTLGVVVYVPIAAKFLEFTAASIFALISCGDGCGDVFGVEVGDACDFDSVIALGDADGLERVLINFWFWKIK